MGAIGPRKDAGFRGRPRGSWLAAVSAAAAVAAGLASPAGAVALTGSITATDATHTGSLTPGTAGSCAAANTPTVSTGGTFNYETHTLSNQSTSASCVTVTYTASQNIFIAAYGPTFNPGNLAQNFLGSTSDGASCGGTSGSLSFNVPASSNFVLDVEECLPEDGVSSYSLDVTGTGVALAARFRSLSATATSRGTLVRWRTASQFDVLGFNVYGLVNGHRVRLNARLIRAVGGGAGHAYAFLDGRLGTRATRYWIQAVDLDGGRSWFGPARIT
jgi:hypothetical protein